MTQEPVPGLDALIGWNAVKVARIIGTRITAQLEEFNISLVQFGVLSCLATGRQMTSADIARAVFVRPQTMSEVLDGMEERGLLARIGTRAKGRPNPIEITTRGMQAFRAAETTARATNDLTHSGLSEEDSHRLNVLLLAVIHAAEPPV